MQNHKKPYTISLRAESATLGSQLSLIGLDWLTLNYSKIRLDPYSLEFKTGIEIEEITTPIELSDVMSTASSIGVILWNGEKIWSEPTEWSTSKFVPW